jgi:hypothetical protein
MLAVPGVVIEAPDGGPVFLVVLGFHVIGGMTGIVAGIVASFSRKRRGRHPAAGRVFLGGLAVVAASAVTMALIRGREDLHLLVIALVAATFGLLGWQARKRRRPGWRRWHGIGMGGAFITLVTGFYVDNGARLPVWNLLPSWTYWVLPSLIGIPLIWWAVRRNTARRPTGQAHRLGLP